MGITFDTLTTTAQNRGAAYLEAAGDMQSHFLDIGCREGGKAVLLPLLDQVVERLLSSVLHGQTLGAVLGCGEGPETCSFQGCKISTKGILLCFYHMQTLGEVMRCDAGSLTHDVGVVDFLQQLCLLIEALLVNLFLLAGTFAVDLLDGPWRCIQLLLPVVQWSWRQDGPFIKFSSIYCHLLQRFDVMRTVCHDCWAKLNQAACGYNRNV